MKMGLFSHYQTKMQFLLCNITHYGIIFFKKMLEIYNFNEFTHNNKSQVNTY